MGVIPRRVPERIPERILERVPERGGPKYAHYLATVCYTGQASHTICHFIRVPCLKKLGTVTLNYHTDSYS